MSVSGFQHDLAATRVGTDTGRKGRRIGMTRALEDKRGGWWREDGMGWDGFDTCDVPGTTLLAAAGTEAVGLGGVVLLVCRDDARI